MMEELRARHESELKELHRGQYERMLHLESTGTPSFLIERQKFFDENAVQNLMSCQEMERQTAEVLSAQRVQHLTERLESEGCDRPLSRAEVQRRYRERQKVDD